MRILRLACCAVLLLLPAGCDDDDDGNRFFSPSAQVVGSGVLVSESRSVAPFDSIELFVAADITITQGGVQSVTVEADDNLIDQITTSVAGGVLRIDANVNYDSDNVSLVLDMTDVQSIDLFGVGDITATNLTSTGTLRVVLVGVGSVTLAGATDTYSAVLSGVATGSGIDAEGLQARLADITVIGVGDCRITVTEQLDAVISGIGDIFYAGNPATVNATVTGTGNVIPI